MRSAPRYRRSTVFLNLCASTLPNTPRCFLAPLFHASPLNQQHPSPQPPRLSMIAPTPTMTTTTPTIGFCLKNLFASTHCALTSTLASTVNPHPSPRALTLPLLRPPQQITGRHRTAHHSTLRSTHYLPCTIVCDICPSPSFGTCEKFRDNRTDCKIVHFLCAPLACLEKHQSAPGNQKGNPPP
jgi:hypothetical protein